MRSQFLGACLAAVLSLPAQGATFTEGAGGLPSDFSNLIGSPTSLGTLGLGLTTVSGSISATCDKPEQITLEVFCRNTNVETNWTGDFLDFFSFDIGAGQVLVAATMMLSNVSATNVSTSFWAGGFIESFLDPLLNPTCSFVPSGGIVQNGACGPVSILKEPTTGLQQFGVGVKRNCCSAVVGATASFDWMVAFRVVHESEIPPAVIPLPATLPLLLGGLGALALARRRKAIA